MTIEIIELPKSRRITSDTDQATTTLDFYGRGSFSEVDMFNAFIAECPTAFNGILFKGLDMSPIGGGHWNATATYSTRSSNHVDGQGKPDTPPSPPDVPSSTDALTSDFSWDINTYTEKITQSKQTVFKKRRNFTFGGVPDNKGAIGITQDGEILGCERVSPGIEFSISKTLGFITLGYLELMYGVTAHTNDASFYGFPKGSVLFMGAQGKPKDANSVTVTYKFKVSPNQTDIVICDGLTVPTKNGHDFLWVGYIDVQDANILWKQPEFVYVERIYDEANFESLGLGH